MLCNYRNFSWRRYSLPTYYHMYRLLKKEALTKQIIKESFKEINEGEGERLQKQ